MLDLDTAVRTHLTLRIRSIDRAVGALVRLLLVLLVVILEAGQVQIEPLAGRALERDPLLRMYVLVVLPQLSRVRHLHRTVVAVDFELALHVIGCDVSLPVARTDEQLRTVRTVDDLEDLRRCWAVVAFAVRVQPGPVAEVQPAVFAFQ